VSEVIFILAYILRHFARDSGGNPTALVKDEGQGEAYGPGVLTLRLIGGCSSFGHRRLPSCPPHHHIPNNNPSRHPLQTMK
jgi:hypothetical protein